MKKRAPCSIDDVVLPIEAIPQDKQISLQTNPHNDQQPLIHMNPSRSQNHIIMPQQPSIQSLQPASNITSESREITVTDLEYTQL